MEGKSKSKYKFPIILGIVILLILLMAFYSLKVSDKEYKTSDKIEAVDYEKDIYAGKKLEYNIKAEGNNLSRIDIQFEPFKGEDNIAGEVVIGIDDSEGKNITEKRITRNNVREKSIYEFEFEKQNNSKDREYLLWIRFDKIEDGKEFFSVKTDAQGNIAIQKFYESNAKQTLFNVITIAFCIYAFGICLYIYKKKDMKIEKIFIYTVPVICLFYMFCIPTFKNHDELWHWFKSYEVSIGQFVTGVDGDTLGTQMPENISKAATDNWTTIDYEKVKDYLDLDLEPDNKTLLYAETSAVYSPVQYIPQGLGIFIARLFTNKVLLLAYAGRLMNMIVSILCIYFAIKKIPFGKKIILMASYIPIAIEGFTSLSSDAMTISVAFLYIAYILSLVFSKENEIIGKKQCVFLTVLSVIIALCKIVYIPLTLLLLLIPKEKFKNQKKMKNVLIIIGIACIINLIWLKVASIYLAHFREGDSAVQIRSIFTNPIKYIQNCLYTLNVSEGFWITSMFGQNLGWGEFIDVHSFAPYAFFMLTIWIMFIDETIKGKFKKYQKWIIAFVVLAIIGLIFTSLYVQWTTCENDIIMGIQGRYFIPILPLIILLIGGELKVKTDYKEENLTKLIGIVGTVLQIFVITQCLICHL